MDSRKPRQSFRERAVFAGVLSGILIAFAVCGLIVIVVGYVGVIWLAEWIVVKSGGLLPLAGGIGLVLLGLWILFRRLLRRSTFEASGGQTLPSVAFAAICIALGATMAGYGLGWVDL